MKLSDAILEKAKIAGSRAVKLFDAGDRSAERIKAIAYYSGMVDGLEALKSTVMPKCFAKFEPGYKATASVPAQASANTIIDYDLLAKAIIKNGGGK